MTSLAFGLALWDRACRMAVLTVAEGLDRRLQDIAAARTAATSGHVGLEVTFGSTQISDDERANAPRFATSNA